MNEIKEIVKKNKKDPKGLIYDLGWKIDKKELSFATEIANKNYGEETIYINNNLSTQFVCQGFENYILAHEYYHVLNNENFKLTTDIFNYRNIEQLEQADIFAALLLIELNKEEQIPDNIYELIIEYKKNNASKTKVKKVTKPKTRKTKIDTKKTTTTKSKD